MERFSSKAQARAYFHALRERLCADPAAKSEADEAICRLIRELPAYEAAGMVLAYYPVRGEIDLLPLLEQAMQDGKTVALPVCRGRKMTFHQYTGKTRPGTFGIPEPIGAPVTAGADTLCILPGYACDARAFRLGYGGGFYDRFLLTFPGITVGAFYSGCTDAHFPVEPHDTPCDIVISLSVQEKA